MSIFGENLQFYRKQNNMTQEQLAEQLEVSRQTISKWEAGNSYPEMEKILMLCDLFSCNMDVLMRKSAAELQTKDIYDYDSHMEKRRKNIAFGVTLLILGVAVYELLAGFAVAEVWLNTLFFSIEIIGILVLAVAGMQHDIYRKNHRSIPEFYSQEERQKFEGQFPIRIAAGIGMILIGILISMNGSEFPLREGMTSDFYYGIFMLLVAGAVGLIAHTGIGKKKYNINQYNKENNDEAVKKANHKIGVWCGCIMIIATIFFVVAGLVCNLWDICWLAYPVGGLLCGIVCLILCGNRE